MKAKRKRGTADQQASKRTRLSPSHSPSLGEASNQTQQPVLQAYYPRVVNLRTYLLELLPSSSKLRRRKVASIGQNECSSNITTTNNTGNKTRRRQRVSLGGGGVVDAHRIRELGHLLDSTIVGVLKAPSNAQNTTRQRELAAFTQSQFRSTLGCTDVGATSSQSELIDFAIYSLFNRPQGSYYRPPNILCHGFQRPTKLCLPNQEQGAFSGIRGIVPQYPNKNVSLLKNYPWTDVLGLLGKNCEEIMLHLLLDCGLFVQADQKRETFYQLSGMPLLELQPLKRELSKGSTKSQIPKVLPNRSISPTSPNTVNSPGNIIFVRRRMFYARAAENAKGHVRFGLRHIHVLNRYPDANNHDHTVHIMKYIFPRQFGLHNAFTSVADPKEAFRHPPKGYTLREEEIAKVTGSNRNKLPKRLRGDLVGLIQKLQKRHRRCAYVELLRHYCSEDCNKFVQPNSAPSTATSNLEQPELLATQANPPCLASSNNSGGSKVSSTIKKPNVGNLKVTMIDYATPMPAVSAFCRAVFVKLIPHDLYGSGEEGVRNREHIMRHIDSFIHLRRFESLSLHEVAQGLKVTCVEWLKPPQQRGVDSSSQNLSMSDIRKRTEIFLEFIYYIFDSLLIPLIRSNFYVTETNAYKNRMFYFRHDVWKKLAEPSISHLKLSVFEEVKKVTAERLLAGRSLGYSRLRLLPKSSGARPIVNLRKKPIIKKPWARRAELGSSINTIMTPMHNVLGYEGAQKPEDLGSSLNSLSDIYPRLRGFKEKMFQKSSNKQRFYFVKLDVQSCFDTIPQHRLLRLVEQLVDDDEYTVTKYVEFRPPSIPSQGAGAANGQNANTKPVRKFVSRATSFTDFTTPYDIVTGGNGANQGKKHTVYVDTGFQKRHERDTLLDLLREHVRNNLVKIGKKYYRQKNGIPQGSVVSSLLCNFFYGHHERQKLGFLDCDNALLLRLIDDYLLITTDKELAVRFLQVMLDGDPEYGITVGSGKTLINFEATINGIKIARLQPTSSSSRRQFPYCGNLIDTHTLAITKDRNPRNENEFNVRDSITVDSNKLPGQSFVRKALASFRLQGHAMFLDTKHNSLSVVLTTLYQTFIESAMKIYTYLHTLLRRRRSSPSDALQLLTRAIRALIELSLHLINSRKTAASSSSSSGSTFECVITKNQVRWLASMAFKFVFGRRQTQFGAVLRWLDSVARESKPTADREAARMWKIVREARPVFEGYRF